MVPALADLLPWSAGSPLLARTASISPTNRTSLPSRRKPIARVGQHTAQRPTHQDIARRPASRSASHVLPARPSIDPLDPFSHALGCPPAAGPAAARTPPSSRRPDETRTPAPSLLCAGPRLQGAGRTPSICPASKYVRTFVASCLMFDDGQHVLGGDRPRRASESCQQSWPRPRRPVSSSLKMPPGDLLVTIAQVATYWQLRPAAARRR